MDTIDIMRMEIDWRLAQLPNWAPERCLFVEHDWSPWTRWVPIHRPVQYIIEDPPTLHQIEAYRDRGCRQCGCEERESWDGQRIMIADPNNITTRRR